jgi:O-antigen/teichoic acid export membrane protein
MKIYIKKFIKLINSSNSILINSINLIMGTSISAVLGYLFWIVVTRTHPTVTIGLATTLLSASSLISILGLVGYDVIFLRFLSRSKHRNDQINSGMLITACSTALLSAMFFMFLSIIAPKLDFIFNNIWYLLSFIVFTVFTNWNALTNAVLIAYRRTSFVLVINIIFSLIKLSLPFVFRSGGPMTIFIIVGVALVVNVLLSVAAMMRYCEYVPSFIIHFSVIKQTLRFGVASYISNIFNLLPAALLPIVIINKLGATPEAYFYMAFTIANLLYSVIYSTTLATFADASHRGKNFMQSLKKGTLIIGTLIVPAILFLVLFAPYILNFFGSNYKIGATNILRVLCLSGIPIMIYSLIGIALKLIHDLRGIIVSAASNALFIVVLSLIFVNSYGLNGVGWAWLLGSSVSVVVGLLFIVRWVFTQRSSCA